MIDGGLGAGQWGQMISLLAGILSKILVWREPLVFSVLLTKQDRVSRTLP